MSPEMLLWCELQCARLVSRPCQHFLDAFEGGGAAAAASMVIVVIISSLWSLKLRARKRAGPGLLLPGTPRPPPQVYPNPDLFSLMHPQV